MSVQLVAPAPAPPAECDAPFRLLAAGVPLTLLMDLATGPDSAKLFAVERSDIAWVPAPRAAS